MTPSAWPRLREELDLLPGPPQADGHPTWTLHDPVRNLFFQIDWASFEILCRWQLADAQAIIEAIRQDTTLQLGVEDVEVLQQFLQHNQLLMAMPGSAAALVRLLRERKGGRAKWLLHNYLFFRIPLVRPDRWLGRWVGALGFFFSRSFFHLTLLAGVFGLFSVYREWDAFSATLVDMLSWQGLAAYGATLIAIKTLHELGHGFTAKRFGCRVPTMGVAFLVLWPVAYTDTNEVWKLTRRDQRLKVAAAGIGTEMIVAVWATLAWAWLPEGLPKSVAFLLSTTTWVSTLVINASPFMRFDGYFLLSDFLQFPNLHARSFALARWDLRERLFALGEPPPEHFSRGKTLALILFAWATWLYRLILFIGIAVLVYHFFIKAVGIFLFLVEIAWFILMPFWSEVKAWKERWPVLRGSRRARRSAWIAAIVAALFVVPWPTRVTGSGLLQPQQQWAIYAPEQARIMDMPRRDGAWVLADELLVQFDSPQLDNRAAQVEARRERLAWQSAAAGFDAEMRRDWQILNEQRVSAEAEESTIAADAVRYRLQAPYVGRLRDIDPDLRVGNWVAHRELIGRVVGDGAKQVVTYVDDDAIHRIAEGDRGFFVADGGAGPMTRLTVTRIDRDAARTLREPELATLFGGHVQVRERQGNLYPERAIYRVLLSVDAASVSDQHSWRGQVSVAADWEAPGMRFLRAASAVLFREFGF